MSKQLREKASSKEYWVSPTSHRLLEIALYYGFTAINHLCPNKTDLDTCRNYLETDAEEAIPLRPEEECALLRSYFSDGQPALPFTVVRERKPIRSIRQAHDKQAQGGLDKKDLKRFECTLDIIGTTRPIADAIVIKTAYEMVLEEYGNAYIEINSLGDKDSMIRYHRELINYYKKNVSELEPECRQLIKKSAFAILQCRHEKCLEVKRNSPHPMSYLSEPSRCHFKEVLEHLEMAKLPYDINTKLVQYHEFGSHTVFRIYVQEEGKEGPTLVASGARWNNLAKKMGFKKDIPGVTTVISLKKSPELKNKRIPKPQFYFIQMGQEAKLRSLTVIEILRRAQIPVYHSLVKDKLTAQLTSAEHLKVPYILIMGQKESMENTVLVREMHNRSQETIRVDLMADYLKRLIQ